MFEDQMMGEMMDATYSAMKGMFHKVAEDDELINDFADICGKARTELIDRGFTHDDAVQIIAASLGRGKK